MNQDAIMLIMVVSICAIVIIVLTFIDRWFQKELLKKEIDSEITLPNKSRKIHKKHDKTIFSQQDFDRIMVMYEKHMLFNMNHPYKERKSLKVLAEVINSELGLDKSVTAYSTIWNGKVQRDSLPPERK